MSYVPPQIAVIEINFDVGCDYCKGRFPDPGSEMPFIGMTTGTYGIVLGPESPIHKCPDFPPELEALALRIAGQWFAALAGLAL